MLDIQVIDDPAAATVALEPMRSRLRASRAHLGGDVGHARWLGSAENQLPSARAGGAPVAADPNREIDRLSASYLIAVGARVVREVGRSCSSCEKGDELTEAITKLVSKYHDESAPGGRAHRLVVVAHPSVAEI